MGVKRKRGIFVLVACLFFIIIQFGTISATDLPPESSAPYPDTGTFVPRQGEVGVRGSIGISLYSGAEIFMYSLSVPQGTNSLKPTLELFYNSHQSKLRQDYIGGGWSLTQNYIERLVNHSSSNISDDKFVLVLNGNYQKLVFSSLDQRYHTEVESFMHITNLSGGDNANGQYWIAKTKDGTSYRFGFINNSELISNLHNYTVRWNLDLVNDTYNNSIFYSYLEDPFTNDSGTSYLDKIEYNNDKSRKIEFLWESADRPDLITTYEEGNKISNSRRLKEVIASANNSLVSRYVIEYINFEPISELTFISNITEYGSDNSSSLSPTKFEYDFSSGAIWDGDTNVNMSYPMCSGYYDDPPGTPRVSNLCFGGADEGNIRFADVNGDGLIDILKSTEGKDASSCPGGTEPCGESEIWISNGTGWTNQTSWNKSYPKCSGYYGDSVTTRESEFCFGGLDEDNIRLEDVNGDGLIDIMKSSGGIDASSCPGGTKSCGSSRILINNGTGWDENTAWNRSYPKCSGSSEDPAGTPKESKLCFGENEADNIRFADVNGDGLFDILYSSGGIDGSSCPGGSQPCGESEIWINNGSGWDINATWNKSYPKCSGAFGDSVTARQSQFCFGDSDSDNIRFADMNGDGLFDILYSSGGIDAGSCPGGTQPCGSSRTLINNGTGWTNDTNWKYPRCSGSSSDPGGTPKQSELCFGDSDSDNIRFADVNGDGLFDILYSSGSIDTTSCPGGTESCGISIIWVNNGSSWINQTSWNKSYPKCSGYYGDSVTTRKADLCFGENDADNIRFSDVNGDGLFDILFSSEGVDIGFCPGGTENCGRSRVYMNNGTTFLLNKITNEFGGISQIHYKESTLLDNTGDDNFSDIGFNIWIVANKTEDNGMDGSHSVQSITTYNYSGGKYEYYPKNEFRGFNYAEEIIGDKVINHWFYQDDAKKGIEYETEAFDNQSNPYSKVLQTWNSTDMGNYYVVNLLEASELTYDGNPLSPRVKNISYEYDNFGNIVKIHNKGDIDNLNDDRYEYYNYLNNSAKWIVNKLKNYTLLKFDNSTKTKERLYSYDNLAYGQAPTKGSLTKEEHWLSAGTNPVINYSYNSFGNLINQTDARGYVTKYRYDLTGTFVKNITDPKGFITQYDYDLGTGNLNYILDLNSKFTNYTYDIFGRITREIQPYDSLSFPTKNYTYEFDGIAPEKIKTSQREQNNTANTYDSYEFYDGFERLIQTKTEADNNKEIVNDVYYDSIGRVDKKSNSYFTAFDSNYTNANSTVNFTKYSYDILNRVVNTTNSDSTSSNATYSHWNVTFYDENGNRLDHSMNAYNQIVAIREYNQNQTYITKYTYDSSDNLLSITDSLNNTWNYTYDSLSRKTSMKDPDTGISNYSYDANGNLIQQISGGGNLITGDNFYREYDNFGRLKAIYEGNDNSTLIEQYTYDPNGERIKTFNNITNTTTYTPFREFMQIRNSSGIFNYTYIYDNDILVARINPDGSKWFYHADHLGSTTLITNQSGGIVENTFYLPYGEVDSGGTQEKKLYENKEFDLSTGQYYYGARYYDPYKQIFIQPDSIIPNVYDPQQLNIYSFKRTNPYTYVDPSGHSIIDFATLLGNYVTKKFGYWLLGKSYEGATSKIEAPKGSKFYADSVDISIGGISTATKVVSKADDLADAFKFLDKGENIGKGASKVDEVAGIGKNFGSGMTIEKIDPNKISHILQSQHNWGKVVDNPDNWDQISKVIDDVLKSGSKIPHSSQPNIDVYTKQIKGQTVEVRFNNKYGIENAFVQNG
ncbi:MAG: toxin TcdB middle/N-terminal domain-containing protein [Nanoarchaeota archaeon]